MEFSPFLDNAEKLVGADLAFPSLRVLASQFLSAEVAAHPEWYIDDLVNVPADLLEHFIAFAPYHVFAAFVASGRFTHLLSAELAHSYIDRREDVYRHLFAQKRDAWPLQDKYLSLIDVYANASQFVRLPLSDYEQAQPKLLSSRVVPFDKDPLSEPMLAEVAASVSTAATAAAASSSSSSSSAVAALAAESPSSAPKPWSVVCSESEFVQSWRVFTERQLDGLDWTGVLCAGGAVAASMALAPSGLSLAERRKLVHSGRFPASDIDLFFYGLTEEQAQVKLAHIEEVIRRNNKFPMIVVRSAHAVTFVTEYPCRHVQVVLRLYKSPAEVLLGFDVDSCAVGFDGSRVWCSSRAQRAFLTGYNWVSMSRRSPSYELRLLKYSQRGFGVIVPGLQRESVDTALFDRPSWSLAGLGRLLLMDKVGSLSALRQHDFMSSRMREDEKAELFVGKSAKAKLRQRFSRASLSDEVLSESGPSLGLEASDYSAVYLPWGPKWKSSLVRSILIKKQTMLQSNYWVANRKIKRYACVVGGTLAGVLGSPGTADMSMLGRGNANANANGNDKPKPTAADLEFDSRLYVSGPLAWVTDDPGRQYIGSFCPSDETWDAGVYKCGPANDIIDAIAAGDEARAVALTSDEQLRPNYVDRQYRSLLSLACRAGMHALAERLIERGAAVEPTLRRAWAPLHYALMAGASDVVRLLLQRGASVKRASPTGLLPSHLCVMAGSPSCLRLLFEAGAELDKKDSEQEMLPVHVAALRRRTDIVQQLLDVDSTLADAAGTKHGLSPAHIAVLLNDPDMLRVVLSKSTSVDPADKTGSGLWTYAVFADSRDVVPVLREFNVSTDSHTTINFVLHNYTPLAVAIVSFNEFFVAQLLDAGATVDVLVDRGQNTSLLDLATASLEYARVDTLARVQGKAWMHPLGFPRRGSPAVDAAEANLRMMKARNAKSAQEINPQASIGFSGPSFGMGAFRGQMQSTVALWSSLLTFGEDATIALMATQGALSAGNVSSGASLGCLAAACGAVRFLEQMPPSLVASADSSGVSPLHIAVWMKDLDLAALVLRRIAGQNDCNERVIDVLRALPCMGDDKLTSGFLDVVERDYPAIGDTPIIVPLLSAVELFLSRAPVPLALRMLELVLGKTDPDTREGIDSWDRLVLGSACMRGDRELITAVLTKVKVELPSAATRSVGVMGMSPHSLQQTTCACLLAAFDHVETLEWMLKASSVSDVVNHVDNSHSTPIMHALANASLRCVTLLLDMGAKTTVRCRNGLSLARFALGDGNHNVDTTGLRATGLHVAVQKRVDCMKLLFTRHPELLIVPEHTASDAVFVSSLRACASAAVDAGALTGPLAARIKELSVGEASAASASGSAGGAASAASSQPSGAQPSWMTLLHVLLAGARRNALNMKYAEALVELGLGVDACDSSGWTPLMVSVATSGIDEAALWLLERGANPDRVNNTGMMLLRGAVGAGLPQTVRAILDRAPWLLWAEDSQPQPLCDVVRRELNTLPNPLFSNRYECMSTAHCNERGVVVLGSMDTVRARVETSSIVLERLLAGCTDEMREALKARKVPAKPTHSVGLHRTTSDAMSPARLPWVDSWFWMQPYAVGLAAREKLDAMRAAVASSGSAVAATSAAAAAASSSSSS